MAKKTIEQIPGPDPLPKVGDAVEYTWPDTAAPELRGQLSRATVASVYAGLDGRVVDLDVDSGNGVVRVTAAPWRDDGAGNTWQ